MSRRGRHSLSPSLFPFLAVLVCTLGTLILFLALVAQNATEAAEQNARAEQLAKSREAEKKASESIQQRLSAAAVQSMIDEEQFRVEQLVAFRDQQTADLGERRDQLTYLEDQMRRLQEKLKRLSDEVEQAMGDAETTEVAAGDIALLRQRIDDQQKIIEKLRRESKNKTPRVVIVPHQGPNGTDRRPVYLECTAEGVTIWPEGSRISITQLEDANYSANPLDAALRTIRLHVMQNYGDTTPPYPLLIVRPDGIDSYAAARGAMQNWDDQFGYELVPAEVKLAYSKADSNLKQRVDLAIREAAAKQHAQHAIAGRLSAVSGSSLARVADRYGTSGTSSGQRLPTLSAASLDRDARSNGFRSHRDFPTYGSLTGNGDLPYGSNASGVAGSRYGDLGASDDPTGGPVYPVENALADNESMAAAERWAKEMEDAAEEMSASNSDNSNVARHGDASNADQQTSNQQRGADDTQGANGKQGTDDEQRGGQDEVASGQTTDRATAGQFKNDHNQQAETDSNLPLPGTDLPPGGESASPGKAESMQGLQSAGAQRSQPPSGMSMPIPVSGSDSSQNAASPPSATGLNATPEQELVRRQGRDWALPPEMAGARGNAIVRNIRVLCYPDRFVLLGSARGGATEVFGFSGDDVRRATLRLATAVRDRIDRWGPAVPGGKWQPQLDVSVMPGGEIRFHQLRTLMNGSGVGVTGRTQR